MPSLHSRALRLAPAALLVALGLTLAACSSGGSGPTTPSSTQPAPQSSSPSAPAGAEPISGAGAAAAIEANWATFFNAKTPIPRRLALLQDGQAVAPVIRAQAGSSLALLATSKVTKVTLTGTSQASVTYTIFVGGKPALPNQSGVAVYQGGVWKVGLVSFCGLLKLENAGKTAGLPAACTG
ncbi:MAG TPA: hypothetical protein VF834_04735 [Streptosporangiaceae bacterium]